DRMCRSQTNSCLSTSLFKKSLLSIFILFFSVLINHTGFTGIFRPAEAKASLPDSASGELTTTLEEKLSDIKVLTPDITINLPIEVPAYTDESCDPSGGEVCSSPAVTLWATLIRPTKTMEKLPTILVYTPYRREFMSILYLKLIPRGYNLLLVDIRGTGSSEGEWQAYDLVEHHDLKHIIDEFIPGQSWSNGKVGMIGPSYMAIDQFFAAALVDRDSATGEPVHLKAIFPILPLSDIYKDIAIQGGNLNMEFGSLWIGCIDALALFMPLLALGEENFNPSMEDLEAAADIWMTHLTQIPSNIEWMTRYESMIDCGWFDKKSPMCYWPDKPECGWGFAEGDNNSIAPGVSVFMTSGWFDIFTRGGVDMYNYGLKNHSNENKAMIVGEWYHFDGSFTMGLSSLENCSVPGRWFDWKVKGIEDPFMKEFPVILRVMGENRWRAEKSWPLPESRLENKTYYFSKHKPDIIDVHTYVNYSNHFSLVENIAQCDLNSENPEFNHSPLFLHGMLSRSSVRWAIGSQAIPSQVSKHWLNTNIDSLLPWEDERYDDTGVLAFSSDELAEDVEIVGPMTITFWAKSEFGDHFSALLAGEVVEYMGGLLNIDTGMITTLMDEEDVQWIAELNDVFPDGRARNISSGWLRASHRQRDPGEPAGQTEHALDPGYVPFDPFYCRSDRNPKEIVPGELYQYSIEIWPTCSVFKKGHRIRVTLSGSDFPHLLPVLVPSTNTIVIDDTHQARIDFTTTNTSSEGAAWKWIDDIDDYLVNHTDSPGSGSGSTANGDGSGGDTVSSGNSSGGCGSAAVAGTGYNPAFSVLPGFLSMIMYMLFPLGVIFVRRLMRRGR
ncbi:MAG: CocE/NonD family hydrolase, partial [bacterium]|nr:CocE/NonD family hydrolase [bacterium]